MMNYLNIKSNMKNLFSIEGKQHLLQCSRGIGEMIAAGFLANGAKGIYKFA